MFVPNKTVSLSESNLSVAAKLLSKLQTEQDLFGAYQKNKKLFTDMSQFIDTVSLLFLLGKININFENGVLEIAEIN